MDEMAFKRGEADLDQAAGTVDKETEESRVQTLFEVGENVEIASGQKWFPGNVLKTDMRNGVEMVKVEYSTLFQDKKKKTKRLQESVSSDRIRPQPPSEKPEETKSLELMDNARNMMRDSIPELLALPELKHPIGSDPKPKEPLDGSHTSPLSQQDRNMMRDSIPELLALPELKHPIGSEPKPKEPLDGSHASPLSQQVETQVYSPNLTQHMEKEPSNQTHAAQSQIFSTNVTQQPLNESPASPLSQQIETHVYSPDSAQHIEKEQLDEAPDAHTQVFSPNVTQQIETQVYSPNSAQHVCAQSTVLTVCVFRSNVWKLLYIFMMAFLIFCIEKEQLNEAPDAHTQKEIEPSLDEMPSNPNRGEENLDDEMMMAEIMAEEMTDGGDNGDGYELRRR
ncbi:hypothetical protein F2Q69_00060197 [Brassica cretica]|uniref:Agenet domain-containing protein n=1 Tax=Brassica cretica TaxID=69181 RepID=A0A8S9RHQ0_BRACR|nr:hypothetical protein F2Q69_00060197 [Brassica cretica]